jgi:predicted metal-dependent hydrolase
MQKSQNILYYEGLGEVYFVKSQRARKLSIRINQAGEVRVSLPRFVSQKQAERFLLSKQPWIQKHLQKLKVRDCKDSLPPNGGFVQIRGKEHRVQLLREEPDVEAAIWRMLQKEAKDYLPRRVKELSEQHGYKISGIKIRKMRTRWGSCSAAKNINLNSWLVMLPEYLSDYVILHELVHTKIPDHSSRFWEELDGITRGQSKKYRRELRNQQIMCFPGDSAFQ